MTGPNRSQYCLYASKPAAILVAEITHMSQGDIRRHPRVPQQGKVRISWVHTDGLPRFAQARCFDVSQGGVRIEVPEPPPLRSNMMLHSEQMKLAGPAIVKHVTRQGTRYTVGLALCSTWL